MTVATLPIASGASSRGSHQLACAMQCPRRWMLRYHNRIIPEAEPPWRLGGTLIHDAVAHRYAERLMANGHAPPSWWTGATIDDVLAHSGAGHPDLIQCAREVYDAYPKYWWQLADEPWDPVAVEEEYQARVVDLDPEGAGGPEDDEIVTCRTDLVVRHRDSGDLFVVDHKTKSINRKTGQLPAWGDGGEYKISWQACINLYLIRRAYSDDIVRGFIVNRISRQPPYLFDRHVLEVSPRVYETVPRVIRQAVAAELALQAQVEAGDPPCPSYWECNAKYGDCDYLPLCNAKTNEEMNQILESWYVGRPA